MNSKLLRYITIIFFVCFININRASDNSSIQNDIQYTYQEHIELSKEAINSDLNLALYHAHLALHKANKSEQPSMIYEAYNQIAVVFFYIGLMDEAVSNWMICDEIATRIEDKHLIAKTNFQLSALHISLKNYNEAEKHLEIAKDYFLNNSTGPNNATNRQSILNNQAIIYEKTQRFELAEQYFINAIEFAKKHQLYSELKTSLGAYSSFLINLEKYHQAYEQLLSLQDYNHKFQYSAQIESTNLIKIYRLSPYLNNINSDSLLNYGYELAKRTNSVSLIKEYAHEKYLLEKQNNNNSSAIYYLEIHDSLLRIENQKDALYKLQLDKIKKDYQQREDSLKNFENKMKRRNLFIILTLIALLIIVTMLLTKKVKQHRQVQLQKSKTEKINQIISNQKDELKKELHQKQKIITYQTIKQINQKEKLRNAISKINKTKQTTLQDSELDYKKLIQQLESEQDWQSFDKTFNQIKDDFYQKIELLSPHLSINEKRLCALLKLNLTTKEITSITGQSVRAVEIARTRLRKKLGLTKKNIQLTKFLQEL